ncbi:MAG TPA: hypothetical protein VEG33_10630 [Streptosporangiaceae bacterium]|nr:hypothetical protein [Streptosporangiaceae bacterium]
MFELQHFDDGLDLLIEWDSKRHYGCLRGVVYDRPEVAQDATRLAVNLNVSLMTASDLPDRPKTTTLHVRGGPGTHTLRRSRPGAKAAGGRSPVPRGPGIVTSATASSCR